jgi:hypothetical protein
VLCPLGLDFGLIVGFEVAITGLMKGNQNGDDLTQTKTPKSMAQFESTAQKLLLPAWFKLLRKIIDSAEEFF